LAKKNPIHVIVACSAYGTMLLQKFGAAYITTGSDESMFVFLDSVNIIARIGHIVNTFL
jgi:hypothetical protein